MSRAGRSSRAGLVWTLVRTDFKVRYHGSLGGFVWALAKPLAMFLLLLGVFSFVFDSDPDYRLNLVIGLFLYDFFNEATKVGLTALHSRGFLVTRARCPAWILIVTSISNALITLAAFTIIMFVFLWVAGRTPGPGAAALYLTYVLALVLIVTGFSLAASVLFLRYRDLNQVWDVAAQAGFFLAPIIYPLDILPERFHWWLYLWAPTPIIEFARDVLVRGVTPSPIAHLYLGLAALTSLGLGWVVMTRFDKRIAEYL